MKTTKTIEIAIVIIFIITAILEYYSNVKLKKSDLQDENKEYKTNLKLFIIGIIGNGITNIGFLYIANILSEITISPISAKKLYSVIYWFSLFLFCDFLDYWFHRLSHTIKLLWTVHIVHHQPQFFNLSVGIRFSPFVSIFNSIFIIIPVFFQYNPADILFIINLQALYQLFIHTEKVNTLGLLEHVLMTPSNHRVHHGSNEKYIDKNFGKVFIFWDKLFGTYTSETEKVNFGLVEETHYTKIRDYYLLELVQWVKKIRHTNH